MRADPRTYYDAFSVSYNRRRAHGYHALVDDLEAGVVPVEPSLKILEAGCGTGLVMDRLRQKGAMHLMGVDLSGGMLTLARRQGHPVTQGSVTALPFRDGAFDVAYSFKVLAHVPDITGALAEMARVVRPGGTVVVELYNRRSIRGLRWRLKSAVGGERTGHQQRETELFTRYDAFEDMLRYLPANTRLEAIRGAIVVTPAALVLQVPVVGRILQWVERRAARSGLARYAGFLILVLRRV
jgi:ubiquinone/menaquinone biosynthesis C-methylase UbiE